MAQGSWEDTQEDKGEQEMILTVKKPDKQTDSDTKE